jgi:hypothetical protein
MYFNPLLGVTMDGSNKVSQWNDQSSSANHLTQATAASKMTYTASQFGALPGIVANGAAPTFMTNASRLSMTAFTAFVVYKPNGLVRQFLLADDATTVAGLFALGTGAIPTEIWDGLSYRDVNNTYSGGTTYLWQVQSGTGPASCVVKRSGTTLTLNGSSGSSWVNMGQRQIGARSGGSLPASGAFGPILIYNRSLSDAECTLVSTWLSGQGWY